MRRFAWMLPALVGCGGLRPLEEHSIAASLEVGGLHRTYILHVPPSLPAERPAPLVLVFHGGGGRGRQMEGFTGFSALSDNEGFIVAYPDGVEKNWYDGREVEESRAHREKIDDLAFVDALIDEIGRRHPIDPKRIYATGISNGAFFSHWLAAHRSGRIAAIAPVVGGMAPALAEAFQPERPVSVLILQGTEDPLVPYSGGDIKYGRGRTISTLEAVKKWAAHNGCGGGREDEIMDMDREDGTTTLRLQHRDGREGTEVSLYTIHGGGHSWPGGPQYLPERVVGRVCRDFEATPLIWGFFKAHPKP